MIVSAAIVSKDGELFYSDLLPQELRPDIKKHAKDFIYSLRIVDENFDLPYIETTYLRYIYKQTDDLFWLLVTRPESKMHADIRLLGKFVCTIMECISSETTSQTLTEEQRDLFYRHIWRPWDDDPQCPFCDRCNNSSEVWEREFEGRVQFLINIRDGHCHHDDVAYFNGLIAESWNTSIKLSTKSFPRHNHDEFNSDSDSVCSSETKSISEEALIDGCRLKCRLEDLRMEIKRIQDPYLRLFARRNLLDDTEFGQINAMSSAPYYDELNSSSACL